MVRYIHGGIYPTDSGISHFGLRKTLPQAAVRAGVWVCDTVTSALPNTTDQAADLLTVCGSSHHTATAGLQGAEPSCARRGAALLLWRSPPLLPSSQQGRRYVLV